MNRIRNIMSRCLGTFLLLAASTVAFAQVNVTLTTDGTFTDIGTKERIAQSASVILTEINNAQKENRVLNMLGKNINKEAQTALGLLWSTTHFYCDDEEVVERMWPLVNNTYLIRRVPLIITPTGVDVFGTGTYQEAVMEFDATGRLIDFRLALDQQMSESLENCGEVADQERYQQILSYLERFRTAYNTKDSVFLEQIYSDEALIITGKVVTSRESGIRVVYNQQNKRQYLRNLKRAFRKNAWINVEFEFKGNDDSSRCPGITRSRVNPNFYGVRVTQHWKSSTYSDDGYLFLLWDFTNENKPQIHVRTWQPEWVGSKKLPETDIFDTINFEEDIKKLSNS